MSDFVKIMSDINEIMSDIFCAATDVAFRKLMF